MDKLITAFYLLPLYQSVILAALLFIINRNRPETSRWIMGIFLSLTALLFGFNLLYSMHLFDLVVKVYFLVLPLILMFIPLFYLYVESVTTPGFLFQRRHGLHFLPAFGSLVINVPYLLATHQERYFYITHGFGHVHISGMIQYLEIVYVAAVYGGCILQLLFYGCQARRRYNRHKTYILDHFSDTENISVIWIRSISYAFGAFILLNFFLFFMGLEYMLYSRIFYNMCMLAFTLFAGYHGLMQIDLPVEVQKPFSAGETVTKDVVEETAQEVMLKLKYSGSSLSESQKQILTRKLEKLMREEKIYTIKNLSIDDVAIRLETNSKYISQLLNEKYQRNFFTYINTYRIEEAKHLMRTDPQQKYSIFGIAQMAGFSSKSTFNEAFKQLSGTTPSEFRKSVL